MLRSSNHHGSAPQGQHNSIANDPIKLTQPTQHASRWRMREGRGGQFDGVIFRNVNEWQPGI